MKLKNKIIKWLGGYTEKEMNIHILKENSTIAVTKEYFTPLTYAAKTMIHQSTIDIFGLENVMSTVKKDLARQISDKIFETTNVVKYEQEKNNNEEVIITAKLTLYVKEN